MKIFEFKSDEIYWICAEDLESAINYYTQELDSDISEVDQIIQIPESEWEERNVYDYNESDDNDNPLFMGTFKDLVVGVKEPEIISTTNW